MNQYMLFVYNWDGQLVHIFDSWRSLDYNLKINEVNDLTLTLQDTSSVDLESILVLDYLIEVRRKVGLNDWYTEDWFFVRTPQRQLQENGTYTWIEYARGVNDLIDRRAIEYFATQITVDPSLHLPPSFSNNTKTSKTGPADDVMKQFVEENCGPSATVVNGRRKIGTFPNFLVGANVSAAPTWTGSRAYKGLLGVLQEIGKANSVDFFVTYDQPNNLFVFTTAYPQKGRDLSDILHFRPELGNMSNATHTLSRTEEATSVLVNGQGLSDERIYVLLESIARYDSPYNTREVVLDQRNEGTVEALTSAAEAKLNEVSAQHSLKFTALEIPGYQYGKDFFLGDRVTVSLKGYTDIQKLVQVHVNMSEGNEQVSFTFGDYMAPTITIVEAMKLIIKRLEGVENSGDI